MISTLIVMASFKRKAPVSKLQGSTENKKSRVDTPKLQQKKDRNLETETDSDPIVESDTTEHSGDNDGVSWPSDEEEVPLKELSMEDDGGVELPRSSSTKNTDIKKPSPFNDNAKGVINCKA